MDWYNKLVAYCTSPFKSRKAPGDTGELACGKPQRPSPLPSKRINLTQESLVDQSRKASGDTDELACGKPQKPSPLPSKRINLTQESLVDQARHLFHAETSISLGNANTSATAPPSPLLSLPYELRTYIYALSLGGNVFNMWTRKHGRIATTSVPFGISELDSEPDILIYPSILPFHHFGERVANSTTQFPAMNIALLFTCRSIYREAVHSLYASNTFRFTSLSVLINWADLSALPPQRLASIRHLSLRWTYFQDPMHFLGTARAPYDLKTWYRWWEIVATRLPGLRSLELRLGFVGREDDFGVEKDWAKAMMDVQRIKEVSVEVMFRMNPLLGERCKEIERALEEQWLQE